MKYEPKFSDYVRICGWGHYDLDFENCNSRDEIAEWLVKHDQAEKFGAEELWAKFEEYQKFQNRRSFIEHSGNGTRQSGRPMGKKAGPGSWGRVRDGNGDKSVGFIGMPAG